YARERARRLLALGLHRRRHKTCFLSHGWKARLDYGPHVCCGCSQPRERSRANRDGQSTRLSFSHSQCLWLRRLQLRNRNKDIRRADAARWHAGAAWTQRGRPGRMKTAERKAVVGSPDLESLTTSHVERVFLSVRQE